MGRIIFTGRPADGRVGGAENPWKTLTNADDGYQSSNGDRLLCDTSGGAFSINLPGSPTVGDQVRFMDVGGNFATNALTVSRNGSNILATADDLEATNQNAAFALVYTGASAGWTLLEL